MDISTLEQAIKKIKIRIKTGKKTVEDDARGLRKRLKRAQRRRRLLIVRKATIEAQSKKQTPEAAAEQKG